MHRTHGMSNQSSTPAPEYYVWSNARARCSNPKLRCWKHYGGRGITFDSRWDDFAQFMKDMGPRPPGTQLERVNNDLGYGPENCVWATRRRQARNKRSSKLYQWKGEDRSLTEIAQMESVLPDRLIRRVRCGWPLQRAVSAPPMDPKVRTYSKGGDIGLMQVST